MTYATVADLLRREAPSDIAEVASPDDCDVTGKLLEALVAEAGHQRLGRSRYPARAGKPLTISVRCWRRPRPRLMYMCGHATPH